jgi:hypothetical protein
VAILVLVVVCFVNLMEQTVVRDCLEVQVDQVAYNRNNGHTPGDLTSVVGDVDVLFVVGVLEEICVKDSRKYKRGYTG